MRSAKIEVVLRPFMRPKELLRALGQPRVSESALARRVGWKKLRGLFALHHSGEETSSASLLPLLPPGFALKPGTYRSRALSGCFVPLATSLALAAEYGLAVRIADPEPMPPPRPPPPRSSGTGVVAVLAHVDHGKTTLLDALLGSNAAAREAGGITQCVRPSLLRLPSSEDGASSSPSLHTLAFVDTPGHQVFEGMRTVVADGADLALVLVAVDAGIQRQTREVLRRCAARGQPVLFALTKADTAGECRSEALTSRRVVALRAALRRLWATELRRVGTDRHAARLLATRAAAPPALLCAPRGWGLDALVSALRCRLLALDGRASAAPAASAMAAGHGGGGGGDGGGGGGVAATMTTEAARSDGGRSSSDALCPRAVPVWRAVPPEDEAVALVLESRRAPGKGTTLLVIVRHGTLRHAQHFVCGSASGRVRQIGLVERGDGGPGPTGGVCEVRSATAGQPVRLLVGWDDAKSAGVGRFEVGDLLRAWPREEALALASYRQSVEAFLDSRIELDEPMGKAAREAALPEGEALEGPEAVEAAVEADEPFDQWAEAPDGLARAERLGEATGAAAILKAQSAGELQGMLDFLASRQTGDRLILLSYGVGMPRDEEMLMAKDALEQEVPCAIYTLNLKVPPERHRRASSLGVSIREHSVFHELLVEMLDAAKLAPPKRELAAMADDGTLTKQRRVGSVKRRK
jgi:small GTP-binding protein